jgi:phosphatidylglycerophosphate synthase
MDPTPETRRPLKSRNTAWAAALARFAVRIGLRPNQISIGSVLFGAVAGICLWATSQALAAGLRAVLDLAAAACIQLRLLCNLIDGMVAVEGGMRSKAGELWNELPDRFADAFILVGAGLAPAATSTQALLGWSAAVLAVITAYVRALGAATGTGQHFCGPMAKQQRMAVLTVACVIAALEAVFGLPARIMLAALIVIVLGCLVTIARRLSRIAAVLNSR